MKIEQKIMVLRRSPRNGREGNTPNNSEDEEPVGDLIESEGERGSAEESEQGEQSDGGVEAQTEIHHIRRSPRLLALRQERERLRRQYLEEEFLLQQEIARRDEILREVQRMGARRRRLRVRERRDREILANLERQVGSDGESERSEEGEEGVE